MEAEVMHPVCMKTSDGKMYRVDWRDVDEVFRRDPDAVTLPNHDPNELTPTAEDCVFLWSLGIGF